VAIGFDAHRVRAVALPAIALGEPNGCSYQLNEIEGQATDTGLAGYAVWTVNGVAVLAPRSFATSPCAPELPVTGAVELMGPQALGYGVIPWGLGAPYCGETVSKEEAGAAQELSQRMVTATRLAQLGQLSPSAADVPFRATGAGTLVVAWYAGGARSARAADTSRALVARATTVFSSSGTKLVRVTLTRRGRRLLRSFVTLRLRASFKSHGSAAIVVTGTRSIAG
jgi:hypothetical protein